MQTLTTPITSYYADLDPTLGMPSLLLKRVTTGDGHRDFIMRGQVSFWDLDRNGILAASLRLGEKSGLVTIPKDSADAFLAVSSDWVGPDIELGPQISDAERDRFAALGRAVDSFPAEFSEDVKFLLQLAAKYAEANTRLTERHFQDVAYRPEIASGVAVKLTEEADWDMLARWSGGVIQTRHLPESECAEIVIPGVGVAREGTWLHMDTEGVVTIHEGVFWPVAGESLAETLTTPSS
ncbi:hypothetical protein GCM10025867_50940 (plasmid) [Frondihabitans sucicola]|uniref:Uncharacterized protein n=1 Tax=Frondihabitans sucicola TaxID=1268041 RepID=A0ABM8GWQ3_9MICO|nr:hypothetical protein [Frondihabitans sucicola]BDZ52853.1 hypothetical protein GCM10025867_50940 [Frondihabitans sucicola]